MDVPIHFEPEDLLPAQKSKPGPEQPRRKAGSMRAMVAIDGWVFTAIRRTSTGGWVCLARSPAGSVKEWESNARDSYIALYPAVEGRAAKVRSGEN